MMCDVPPNAVSTNLLLESPTKRMPVSTKLRYPFIVAAEKEPPSPDEVAFARRDVPALVRDQPDELIRRQSSDPA
jgi:hypothetical protein